MDKDSGVGVIDKSALLLACLETGPANLTELVERTGLSRPTAHRLAVALEHHRLVARDRDGRFTVGPWLSELGSVATGDALIACAGPVLAALRDKTGESAQLYRRRDDHRVCVAVAERRVGLRDTVPVGAVLTMQAGSAAQVLLAWQPPDVTERALSQARFTKATLTQVRRRGWAQSTAEREVGVGSVSAPVWNKQNRVIAAVSISGPLDRLTRTPGRIHGADVVRAAERLSATLTG